VLPLLGKKGLGLPALSTGGEEKNSLMLEKEKRLSQKKKDVLPRGKERGKPETGVSAMGASTRRK